MIRALTLAFPAALLALGLACSDEDLADTDVEPLGDPVPVDADAMNEAHNVVRRAKGLPDFTWNTQLAQLSEDYSIELAAQGCGLVHSGDEYGENLYWTSATAVEDQVVDAWASEEADYDYDSNTCAPGKQCGHYTQIVWDSTTSVGCGAAKCEDGGGEVWTCKYDPPGNWVGEWPY